MKQAATFTLFLGLALVVHVLVWQMRSPGASQAAGAKGDRAVSLIAINATLQDVVADWDSPPDVSLVMPEMDPTTLPARQSPSANPALLVRSSNRSSEPFQKMFPAGSDPLPEIEQTTPEPSSSFAPANASRPVSRAEPLPQVAEQAAGAGDAGRSGQGTTEIASAQTNGPDPEQMARWGGAIHNAIERRKRYPAATRARGVVSLAMTVSTSGRLIDVSITQSAGDAMLDQAGRTAVQRASIPAAPSGIADGSYRFSLSVTFAP